ncbi:MAG: SEC-C domain-containing protein [Desulfuromonas sp.]|nr:SEC-C domain-containing protein [Desulfuromonas sp.]
MKIGRNDLCPCGSGVKYKKCCLNGRRFPVQRTMLKTPLSVVANHPGTNSRTSTVSQVRQAVQKVIAEKNNQADEGAETISTAKNDDMWQCHAMTILLDLHENNGVKATATGKFARPFCQQHAPVMLAEYSPEGKIIRGEADIPVLGRIRENAEASGLITLKKGKYVTTEIAAGLLSTKQYQQLYSKLVDMANMTAADELNLFGLECV